MVEKGVQAFDTSKPTCMMTDWSQQGIGFLLMQKHCSCSVDNNPKCCRSGWHLTYAGSRFTTEVESRYSPTEGEALAVAWGLLKSRFFTLGCKKLVVATDHQPLVGLFKKQLCQIPNPRLIKIREKTLMYTFEVVYTPGSGNKGADAVSRNPVDSKVNLIGENRLEEEMNDISSMIIASLNENLNNSEQDLQVSFPSLITAIGKSELYGALQKLIVDGFPSTKSLLPSDIQRFWDVKDRLILLSSGIILMDDRIVIPSNHRSHILKILHSSHQGTSSMRRRANSSLYWPGMGNDIKNVRLNCEYCNKIAPQQTKEPLILTHDPQFPFQDVSGDFFTVNGNNYLVLVDRYSGWFTISFFEPYTATAKNLIQECAALFTAYGAPETFASDGGPQFVAAEFQSFLLDWGVKHRMSSAHYPQSNGRAEAAVKTAKRIITSYVSTSDPLNHTRLAQAILEHRNTPLPDLNLSPAQLLFHRVLRDKIPNHPMHYHLHKDWILTSRQREVLFQKKNSAMLKTYNATSKNLHPLEPRTKVLLLNNNKSKNFRWNTTGTIVQSLPFRKYKIRLDGSGRIVFRNRKFLREYLSSKRTPQSLDTYPQTFSDDQTHEHNCDGDNEIDTQQPPNTLSDSQHNSIPEEQLVVAKRLLPYNKPCSSESNGIYNF